MAGNGGIAIHTGRSASSGSTLISTAVDWVPESINNPRAIAWSGIE